MKFNSLLFMLAKLIEESRMLLVIAHPDDEAMFFSPLLSMRQAAGVAASHGFIGVRQLLHHTERLGFTTDGSAEVPSLCHGIMRAASNTQWRCIERCQRATALRSTVGRRLAGDHLMLQDMPFGSCPLARMPCLHTHRSMCLSCVRCAHTLKK